MFRYKIFSLSKCNSCKRATTTTLNIPLVWIRSHRYSLSVSGIQLKAFKSSHIAFPTDLVCVCVCVCRERRGVVSLVLSLPSAS